MEPKVDDDEPPPAFLKNPSAIARYNRVKAQNRLLRQQAYDLRRANHSYVQIAEIQGCTVATARRRYERAVRDYIPTELIDEIRKMELDRFDALQLTLLPMMERQRRLGDIDMFLKLFDRYLAVSDRRVNLTGAKAPVQVQIEGTIVQQSEQDRELQDLLRRQDQVNEAFDRMAAGTGQEEEGWTSNWGENSPD